MAGTLVHILALAGALAVPAASQALPPVSVDVGVQAHAFDISQVVLHDGRLEENQVSRRARAGAPMAAPARPRASERWGAGAGPLLTPRP